MKRLLNLSVALLAIFFMVSCQQEKFDLESTGSKVTFSVEIPEAKTKAALPGSEVNQLVYAVYRVTGLNEADAKTSLTDANFLYQSTSVVDGGVSSAELELVNDQDYIVLFWAQNEDKWFKGDGEGEYHFGTKGVTYPETYVPNSDAYAAFAGVDYIHVDGSKNERIELTRPFAQLNIATKLATNYSINVEGTTVTVEGLATKYNVATGKGVVATEPIQFDEAAPIDDVFSSKYESYLSMNYVFVPDQKTNITVTYTITTDKGTVVNTVGDVPVEKNFRTNIIGSLLTSKVNYYVELDKVWGTPENDVKVISVADATQLLEAINEASDDNATNIKIDAQPNDQGEKVLDLSDITAGLFTTKAGENNYGIQIPAGKSIVLDLNGCTISQKKECTSSYSMIQNLGKLTIVDSDKNGKISFEDLSQGGSSAWGSYVIENRSGAELIVNSGTIVHLGSNNWTDRPTNIPVQNYAGKVTINGGKLSSPSFRSMRDFTAGGEIVINGGTFEGQVWMQGLGNGTSSLTINGGEFTPTDGYDGSSIYITNGTNDIEVNINGGKFNTKIGCQDATKEGVLGCITGGTFTTDAAENTNSALIANGYSAVEADGMWNIIKIYTQNGNEYSILNVYGL